jgi:hypothetical protein
MQASRLPAPDELAVWARLLAAGRTSAPFQATGKVHFESRDGEIDGDLEVRLDPPDRLWIRVHTHAMFGLVGERITVLLPGDGYLLYYRERDDRLERWPFRGSAAADLSPGGTVGDLLALATARIGALEWFRDMNLEDSIRVLSQGRDRGYSIPSPGGLQAGGLRVWLRGEEPARVEWMVGASRQLEVRYDRYVAVGPGRVPTRMAVNAPQAGVRATVRLEELTPRQGFAAEELEVGAARNPAPPGGVHGG